MLKRHILTVILFILIVMFCVAEAFVIVDLKGKNDSMQESIAQLMDKTDSHETTIERMREDISGKENIRTPELILPENIYVCTGMTMDIYNANVCTNVDLDRYSFFWDCSIGDCMKDKFSVNPGEGEEGEHLLTLTVYDESMIEVASAQTRLNVVRDVFAYDTVSSAGLVTIGDSLSAGTEWESYTRARSLDKINHMGRGGDTEGLKYESIPGISPAEMYYGKLYGADAPNSFTNPDTGVFDWDYYVSSTGIFPDAVQVFLGMNGLDIDPNDNADAIFSIVDTIRKSDPSIPILLSLPLYPADQDGMGLMPHKPGYDAMRGINAAERRLMISNLNKEIIERAKAYENVTLVPTAMVFDTDKGFNQTVRAVNPHTEITDVYPDEGMHPGVAGYRQIGDEIYAAMCYLLESGKFRNITVPSPGSVSANNADANEVTADIDGEETVDEEGGNGDAAQISAGADIE